MQKLSNQILASKLRKLTSLTAKKGNVARWSSMFSMLDSFFKIKKFVVDLGLLKIDALYPEDDYVKELDTLMTSCAT